MQWSIKNDHSYSGEVLQDVIEVWVSIPGGYYVHALKEPEVGLHALA